MSDPIATRAAAGFLVRYSLPDLRERQLLELFGRGTRVGYEHGEIICREGDEGGDIWLVLEGTVEIRWLDRNRAEHAVGHVHAPDVIGAWSLVDGGPRGGTCVAMGTVQTVRFGSETWHILQNDPGIAGTSLRRLLLASMSEQLSDGNERIRVILQGQGHAAWRHALRRILEFVSRG